MLLVQISTLKMLYFCALWVLLLLPLFRSLMYGIILKKLKILFCVQSVREFTCLIVYIKNCFTCCWRLIFLMFPTSDDFAVLWDVHWIRIASPSPGNWLTVRSWMLMKLFSFDENWSLVIWRLRWIRLKNVAIYHCRWRLWMLDLTQTWFELVFQAFDFSSQKNRLVMIEWNCQFS